MSDEYKHTFTVKRSRWLRGRPSMSTLRNSNGHQCCLGFYLRSVGLRAKDIAPYKSPSEMEDLIPDEAGWLLDETIPLRHRDEDFMDVNDDLHTSDEVRERDLAEAFAKHGIQVIFED